MPVSGLAGKIRGYHTQDQPAGPFTWNFRLDSSKVTELEVGRMREVVRPWLVMTKTETGGHSGQAVFTLTAHTLGSLATGDLFSGLLRLNKSEHSQYIDVSRRIGV